MKQVPALMDTYAEVVVGVITAAAGEIAGPGEVVSSTATYTIRAQLPNRGVVTLTGQKPEVKLWRGDMLINIDKLIGTAVIGSILANSIRWHFFEPPALGECPDQFTRATTTGFPQQVSAGQTIPGTPTTGTPTTGPGDTSAVAPGSGEI